MNKIITVKEREIYGVRRLYVTSFHAEPLERLTSRKTLTESDVTALKNLGYQFETEIPKI